MRIKVLERVVIGEETCCQGCQKLIGTDPFKFEYSSKRIYHSYCYIAPS